MVTLSFMPYSEIEGLSSVGRIRKLLNIAKENKIVLLQGRLKKEEETTAVLTPIKCKVCKYINPPGARFCTQCAKPLSLEAAFDIEKVNSLREQIADRKVRGATDRELLETMLELLKKN